MSTLLAHKPKSGPVPRVVGAVQWTHAWSDVAEHARFDTVLQYAQWVRAEAAETLEALPDHRPAATPVSGTRL